MSPKIGISLRVKFLNAIRNVFRIPTLEAQLARLTLGKAPNNLISKFVPNSYQYPPLTYRMVYRDGLILRVDISDYMGHYLYFGFRDASMEKLFDLTTAESNVIDVGTNVGWTFLNFAKRCDRGHVIGFEPDPENYEVCRFNVELNDFRNAILLPKGLGTKHARLSMEVRTPGNRGGNRIATGPAVSSVMVDIEPLDEVNAIVSWGHVDLIKIDVEGYELHVLSGARRLLTTHKPKLFIEVDDNNLRDHGHSARELMRFLQDHGYHDIRHAETNAFVGPDEDFTNCHFDVVAK